MSTLCSIMYFASRKNAWKLKNKATAARVRWTHEGISFGVHAAAQNHCCHREKHRP